MHMEPCVSKLRITWHCSVICNSALMLTCTEADVSGKHLPRSFYPSLISYQSSLPWAVCYLLSGLMYGPVSDREKCTSDFHALVSYAVSQAVIYYSGCISRLRGAVLSEMNIKSFPSILHAKKHMINVLLRRGHTLRGDAFSAVLQWNQNNGDGAFYLFYDSVITSVMELFINLPRLSIQASIQWLQGWR